MTSILISKKGTPNYIALSSDIQDNGTIPNTSLIGKSVYLTDLQEYRLILPSLKLIPFGWENGTSGVEPEFDSAEIGNVDEFTVVVTFTENIVASDYSGGVTIKVNDEVKEIDSAIRQSDHAVVYYVLTEEVLDTDVVTWEYNMQSGGIISETGYVYLENVSPQLVTNNI